jgi:hypothetical protein
MKNIFLIMLCIPGLCAGQQYTSVLLPIDSISGKITFTEVVNENANKDKLFFAVRNWAGSTSDIKSKKIQVADKESGEIIVECYNEILTKENNISMCFLRFSISVVCKDNRYKYRIQNFVHEGCDRGGLPGKMSSIGELESVLSATHDRRYFDLVLELTKDMSDAISSNLKKTVHSSIAQEGF